MSTALSFPRVPAASHEYLLPPTSTCCLPRVPAASHEYLLPPTSTCYLSREPAASHEYFLHPTFLREHAACPYEEIPAIRSCRERSVIKKSRTFKRHFGQLAPGLLIQS